MKFEELKEQLEDLKTNKRKEKSRARSVGRLASKSDLPLDENFPRGGTSS
jgi:hypothetical protein